MGQTREGVVQLMYWARERATRTGRLATTESMMAVDGLDAFDECLVVPKPGCLQRDLEVAEEDKEKGRSKEKRRDPQGSTGIKVYEIEERADRNDLFQAVD